MKNVSRRTSFLCGFFLLSCVNIFAQDPNFHIYLGFGQSNMAGAGAIEAQDLTVDNRFQVMAPMSCASLNRTFGNWYPAIPPLWGCPSGGLGPCDYFGRTMVQNLPGNIRVGVIVVGIPGCDIRLFDKTGYQGFDTYNYVPAKYNGSAYAWLMELARLAQNDGVIKGFLMHQGETMPNASLWPGQVKRVYDSLVSDLQLVPSETPLLVGELLYTSAGGCCGGNNVTIARIPTVIPNSYVISASGLAGKDKYHFNSASQRIFGARYAQQMLSLLTVSVTNSPVNNNRFNKLRPVVIANKSVRITVDGYFRYRITDFCGALMEAGNGRGLQTVGAGLTPGMYFLSVEHRAGFFTEKIFIN
jgi:hypothetical protein